LSTYYDILGIGATASEAEIRDAFRKKAKETHPDVNRNTGADQLFMQVNEAYEILVDAHKRGIYDRRISTAARPAPVSRADTQSKAPPRPDPRNGGKEYDEWVSRARAQAQQRARMNYQDFERSTAEKMSDRFFSFLMIPLMCIGILLLLVFMALPLVLMIFKTWWMGIFAAGTIPAGLRALKVFYQNLTQTMRSLR
jgi:curved DNA-binding protein CbpA